MEVVVVVVMAVLIINRQLNVKIININYNVLLKSYMFNIN